jgi:glycosyltransferase involved in cell wall biosynthesis
MNEQNASISSSAGVHGKHVLISPCRDEAKYLQFCVDSVLAQTVPPSLWVIVDDGSTDGSAEMLDKIAEQHSWISVIHRSNRGRRLVGPGVIDAFYAGLESVDLAEFEYLCKFDLDLLLPTLYFERLLKRMSLNSRIGTCSGKPYFVKYDPPRLASEKCGDEMSVGMTKFYRVSCFIEIGGFVRGVMWDGIDCHRCRMQGWIACSWDEENLQFIHMRPMGSSDKDILKGRKRHGEGQYFMGTAFPFMLASCIFRLRHHPPVIGSLAMMWGYLSAMFLRKPRYDDRKFRKFLRKFQYESLIFGKRTAISRIEKGFRSKRWLRE